MSEKVLMQVRPASPGHPCDKCAGKNFESLMDEDFTFEAYLCADHLERFRTLIEGNPNIEVLQ